MRVRVQSKHFLNEALLEKIWRLSADDECFNDWLKNPVSGIGKVTVRIDYAHIWANWLDTNHGLTPVLDLEVFDQPLGWRIALIDSNDRVKAAGELVTHANHKYSLILLNGRPTVVEEDIGEEERKRVLSEARGRLDYISVRFQKLKQRRGY